MHHIGYRQTAAWIERHAAGIEDAVFEIFGYLILFHQTFGGGFPLLLAQVGRAEKSTVTGAVLGDLIFDIFAGHIIFLSSSLSPDGSKQGQ